MRIDTKLLLIPTVLVLLLFCFACANEERGISYPEEPYIIVLGIAQDAGFPQANCQKSCCKEVWRRPELRRMVSCIGIVDPLTNQAWMVDATPDFKDQLKLLTEHREDGVIDLGGIFLTHAHIGHYTGLVHLGREVMGAQGIPVYAMPKMSAFLRNHGPWSQLVALENIHIDTLADNHAVALSSGIQVTPLRVPHRDEFSETVGYSIARGDQGILFIPDIDKWEKWDRDLIAEIKRHSTVLIDGSFYANGEIPGRDMSQIPHPFVEETLALLSDIDPEEKSKVHFIHLNHTNPLLHTESAENQEVMRRGFYIAQEKEAFPL